MEQLCPPSGAGLPDKIFFLLADLQSKARPFGLGVGSWRFPVTYFRYLLLWTGPPGSVKVSGVWDVGSDPSGFL